MSKIIGNTTTTPYPQADWNQNDPTKADYIKNKPDIDAKLSKSGGTMTGNINMGNKSIINARAISSNSILTDALSVTEGIDLGLNEADTEGGSYTYGSICGLVDPTDAHDAANKKYVDEHSQAVTDIDMISSVNQDAKIVYTQTEHISGETVESAYRAPLDAVAKAMLPQVKNPVFGENDSLTDIGNMASGAGNKVGTKAFEILGYSAESDFMYYIVSNVDDNGNPVYTADTIPNIKDKFFSLKIDYNIEHFGKIVNVWGSTETVSTTIGIQVDRIFTNDENPCWYQEGQEVDHPYASRTADNGLIYNTYNLAYAISHKDDENPDTRIDRANRALFVEGMPEVGTFEYRGNSVVSGSDNIVQGDNAHVSGRDNVCTGRYATAFGSGNHVGYDDHAYGRENKMYRALDSVAFGLGNIIEDTREPQPFDMQLTSAAAIGYYNHVSGLRGMAFGNQLDVPYTDMIAVGKYNNPDMDDAFEIGGGSDGNHRKNLFSVKRDGTAVLLQNKEVDAVKTVLTDAEKPIHANTFSGFDTTVTMLPATFKNNTQYRAYCLAPVSGSKLYFTIIKLHVDSYVAGKTKICPMFSDSTQHFSGERLFEDILGYVPTSGEEFYVCAVRYTSSSTTHIGFGFKNVSPYDSTSQIRIDSMEVYPMVVANTITSDKILTISQPDIAGALDVKAPSDLILADGKANYAIKYAGQHYVFGDHDVGSTVTMLYDGEVTIEDGRVTGLSTPKNDDDAATKKYVDDLMSVVTIDADSFMSDSSENPVQNKVIKQYADTKLSKAGGSVYGHVNFTEYGDDKVTRITNDAIYVGMSDTGEMAIEHNKINGVEIVDDDDFAVPNKAYVDQLNGAVRYDEHQDLTDAQKQQVRENIGAGADGISDVQINGSSIVSDGVANINTDNLNINVESIAEQIKSETSYQDDLCYNFRASSGSYKNIINQVDENEIIGSTIVLNQHFDIDDIKSELPTTINGVTFSYDDYGCIIANGHPSSLPVRLTVIKNYHFKEGHVYYMYGWPKELILTETSYLRASTGHRDFGEGCVFKCESDDPNGYVEIFIDVYANFSTTAPIRLYDLTDMFGTCIDNFGNLNSSDKDEILRFFYFHVPQTGRITDKYLSTKCSKRIATGKNQWDEITEPGCINLETGENEDNDECIRSKNYFPVIQKMKYYCYNNDYSVDVILYDANKRFIRSYHNISNNYTFIAPINAAFFKLSINSTLYDNICIYIAGDYEYVPYEQHSYDLPNVVLRGIATHISRDGVSFDGDIAYPNGRIHRYYKCVDLGTLDWEVDTDNTAIVNIPDMKTVYHNYDTMYAICKGFDCRSYASLGDTNNCEFACNNGEHSVKFYIPSGFVNKDTNQIKEMFSGKYLVYKLETHIVEESTPYEKKQFVDKCGTEQFQCIGYDEEEQEDSQISMMCAHKSSYYYNLVEKLDKLPNDPTSNGSYKLSATVTNGNAVYSWKSAAEDSDASIPDWNQNNENEPDYIKNRPFYTEHISDVIFDGNVTYDSGTGLSDYPYGYGEYEVNSNICLENGMKCRVIIKNSSYSVDDRLCTFWYFAHNSDNTYEFKSESYIRIYICQTDQGINKISFDFPRRFDNCHITITYEHDENIINTDFINKSLPDWTQNDPTSPEYIQNRPFYETTEILDDVLFSETVRVTTKKYIASDRYYMSDAIFIPRSIAYSNLCVTINGKDYIMDSNGQCGEYYRLDITPHSYDKQATLYVYSTIYDEACDISIRQFNYVYHKLSSKYVDCAPNFLDDSSFSELSYWNWNSENMNMLIAMYNKYYVLSLDTIFSRLLYGFDCEGLNTDNKNICDSINELYDMIQNNSTQNETMQSTINQLRNTINQQQTTIQTLKKQINALRKIVDPDNLVSEVDEDGILNMNGSSVDVVDNVLTLDSSNASVEDNKLIL